MQACEWAPLSGSKGYPAITAAQRATAHPALHLRGPGRLVHRRICGLGGALLGCPSGCHGGRVRGLRLLIAGPALRCGARLRVAALGPHRLVACRATWRVRGPNSPAASRLALLPPHALHGPSPWLRSGPWFVAGGSSSTFGGGCCVGGRSGLAPVCRASWASTAAQRDEGRSVAANAAHAGGCRRSSPDAGFTFDLRSCACIASGGSGSPAPRLPAMLLLSGGQVSGGSAAVSPCGRRSQQSLLRMLLPPALLSGPDCSAAPGMPRFHGSSSASRRCLGRLTSELRRPYVCLWCLSLPRRPRAFCFLRTTRWQRAASATAGPSRT